MLSAHRPLLHETAARFALVSLLLVLPTEGRVYSVLGRAARVATKDIEARLGSEYGCLVNVSATGALVRTRAPFEAGRQFPLILNLPYAPAPLVVRVVRADAVPIEVPGELSPTPQYHVAVKFTELPPISKHALAAFCGSAFTRHDKAPTR